MKTVLLNRLIGFLIFVGLWFVASSALSNLEFITNPSLIMLYGGSIYVVAGWIERWFIDDFDVLFPDIPPDYVIEAIKNQEGHGEQTSLRQYTVVRMWFENMLNGKDK